MMSTLTCFGINYVSIAVMEFFKLITLNRNYSPCVMTFLLKKSESLKTVIVDADMIFK